MNKNFYSLAEVGGYNNFTFGNWRTISTKRDFRLGMGDVEAICINFIKIQSKNSSFFYVMVVDEEGRLKNVI